MASHSIELPDALRHSEFRFIKLGAEGQRLKAPIEIGWNIFDIDELRAYIEKKAALWDADKASGKHAEMKAKNIRVPNRPEFKGKLNNYSCYDPEFQRWLGQGKNYGVTAAGGLIKLESDDVARWGKLGIIDLLPETFTVQSSTETHQHFYFIGPKVADSPLYDPETGEDIGHIRGTGDGGGRGGMVVGPGSLHPSGVKYKVTKELPIAIISLEAIESVKSILSKPPHKKRHLGEVVKENNRKNKKRTGRKRDPKKYIDISHHVKISDIVLPVDVVSDTGIEIQGSHPIHGSTSGKNFSINPVKNTWHCFRCESGGGPLEWIAVKEGLISCAEAGPGCLRSELFKKVLELARGLGYDITDHRQSSGQVRIIDNRIIVDHLPEELPLDPVIVIEAPPRTGKTHWACKQLKMAKSGNYISHRHSIVQHALEAFRKEGGQYAVWLEGKHRRGMCRKERSNCASCEYCPHDKQSYMDLKDTAQKLLFQYKILTKELVPSDLCPYYVLKLAEESANYCFTVVNFIEDIQQRSLTVMDEDPTLAYFYPASVELFRFKKERYIYKIDNTLGKTLEQALPIRDEINKKGGPRKEDKTLLWAIDTLAGLNETINTTMSSKSSPEQCYEHMEKELAAKKCEVSYEVKEKALKKVDGYRILDINSENDIKPLIGAILYSYKKRPLHLISSGGSGYRSVYLIGDASAPTINMRWTDTARASGRKILIIGNTLAELFGKSLGNAIVLEIQKYKYDKNFIIVPIDSGGEETDRGDAKKQRTKVRKIIKAVADDPDSKTRRPIMALVGSKEHQDWLTKSLGGICHASQEEGEVGQQWNYKGGYVNIFYQNSVVSRGLDVDHYNVICVHDTDFVQPFWSAALEAGAENAEAILNSIQTDETTNSVLRISPVMGHNEHQPKVVIIPRADLWKVRYLDEKVLGGRQGGRTPDINYIADVIKKNNLTGIVQLTDSCISIDGTLSQGWEEAVKEGKLVDYFKLELDRLTEKGNFTEEEIADAMGRILKVLKKGRKEKGLSISGMRENGLKCNDALLRLSLQILYYERKILKSSVNRKTRWSLK